MLFLIRYVPEGYLLITCLSFWVIWLLLGTLFYTYNSDYYWTNGFYMAVNVGYSVGWGFPGDFDVAALWFSTFYVMTGVVAVAGIIGLFTDSVIEGRKQWVTSAVERNERNRVGNKKESRFHQLKRLLIENRASYMSLVVSFIWIILGIVWSMKTVKWSFSEAVYFAVSTLSTGGLWPIPEKSSNEKYGFVAFYAAIGIPIMGRAAGDLAAIFLTNSSVEQEMLASIDQRPSIEEIHFIEELRTRAGTSQKVTDIPRRECVSEAEFVIICLRRTKSVDTALIEYIYDKYEVGDLSPSLMSTSQKHDVQEMDGNGEVDDSKSCGSCENPTVIAMEITDGENSYREVPSSQL